MSLLLRFFFLLCLFVTNTFGYSQTNPTEPNILVIIADDMGIDYYNGYQMNNLVPVTPTLDSLRETGILFDEAWLAPRCTPSRANILTGRYGAKNQIPEGGNYLQEKYTTLFEAVKEENPDYGTALFGKWHLGANNDFDDPNDHGADHYEGFMGSGVDDYYDWSKITNGVSSPITEYVTAHLTTAANDWIAATTDPWMVVMAHAAPHGPFHVPPAGTYSIGNTDNDRRKYTAMIESMDYEINNLLSDMDPDVLANTLIFFIGDNGTPGGVLQYYPTGHGKNSLYEGGVHIPLIVSGEGVTRMDESEPALVHGADLYATILEAVGATIEGGIDNSLSFYPLLSSASGFASRLYNYTQLGDSYAIREANYKLIVNNDNCTEEFYHVAADDTEVDNLINTMTAAETEIYNALVAEATIMRRGWSCQDGIKNGQENAIDCGGSCSPCVGSSGLVDCKHDSLVVTTEIVLDTFVYAEEYIETDKVLSSAEALLQAGDCVSLQAGFDFVGGDLEVSIEDCIVTGIADANCSNDNSMNQSYIECCLTPSDPSIYTETISGDIRMISTNNFPNHDYCYNNNAPVPITKDYEMDATPETHCISTSILSVTNQPRYFFGVALNGVLLAPAPATPFIFTDSNGEYNWDWVYEPTNNYGEGADWVSLDCASAHTNAQGYHYHGRMDQYIEEVLSPGLTTATTPPTDPVQVGWAADGFPIFYRFGPDNNGNLTLLQPSYRLKYGNRSGDGLSAPCGSYNGKYTNDYEYVEDLGDLDECNGVARTITITTAQGSETFDYFYMITDAFPVIGRCHSGVPDPTFD